MQTRRSLVHTHPLKGNTHKIRRRTKALKNEGVEMVKQELLVRKMKWGVVVDPIPQIS